MKSSKKKSCQNCKSAFVIEKEDFEFYQKIDVPSPTFCPECRAQRRMAFRNERMLFKREDDFNGKEIFSMHELNADVKVYNNDIWYSDKWDPMEYGKDYDFEKNFFDQIKGLTKKVPWISRSMIGGVNSDYCMNAAYLKNCYFVFNSAFSEDCAYCNNVERAKDCFDCYFLSKCELCYEGFMLRDCYQAIYSSHCEDCQDIMFCNDCIDCSSCFGCTNLRHKKYHIFNQEYSKEEYFEKLKEFDIGSYDACREVFREGRKFSLKHPVKYRKGRKNVNVTGEYVNNCKNVFNSYMTDNAEDSKYLEFTFSEGTKDCHDGTVIGRIAVLTHECAMAGQGINNLRFCLECYPDCRDMEYCVHCHSSSNLFGCVGLNKKQYCIFNKQYTKQEYEQLVPRIKKQMDEVPFTDKSGCIYKYGEFFPPEIFPFSYNNTIAQEYFPLTKEKAIEKGYRWYDKQKSDYKPTIKAKDLPDHIKDTDDSILKEIIECQNESNNKCQGSGVFRIIPKELKFYQKHKLPLSRLCPDCRHTERIKQRNPMKLYKRQCMCDHRSFKNQQEHSHGDKPCPNTFETTYSTDRPEIVYCRECYLREVE